MANRVSNDQLEELLSFLAEHPALARGVGLGSRSKETVERQWNDLAIRLNSFGSGSSKTGDRWKKYWADLKHKSKNRLARRREDARGTGGGPSNQEDLSEIDKKILAIIEEQAVYGDTQHRVPVFNIQPEVQVPMEPDNIVVLDDVVISDISELPESVAGSVEAQTQRVPEPHQTGLESPVSQHQPARSRPRRRHNRDSTSILRTRIDPEWVKELERNRVQAENMLADAALMFAEAVNKIAEAVNKIAEASIMNAETNRMNAETSRMQLDIIKAVSQPNSALAARNTQ